MTFSGTTDGITAAMYDCGLGYPTNFPPAVSNNIALMSRGELNFSVKVANAMAAGAAAAIIYNNTSGIFFGTLGSAGNWIPAVSISQADGLTLQSRLPASGTVIASGKFEFLDGTSMATPHVTAAVAFAAMNFPNETAVQRVQRVLTNVDIVPSLSGKVITSGRLNLKRIVDVNANGLPDWWEQTYFGSLTGTGPNADPDHDGATTLAEWLAGTNPTNSLSHLFVTSLTNGNAGLNVTWQSVSNRNYFVMRATNLAGPVVFQTIATNILALSPTTTYQDTNAPAPGPYFYRIGIQP